LSAELGSSSNKILLATSRHKAGVAYTVRVSGVRGADIHNIAFINSSFAYTYLPNLQIDVEGNVESSVANLAIGKEYYIDRNYVITGCPDEFKNMKMIMTSNNDRANTGSRYMTIRLTQHAFVYIAYDSRAVSVPNWLDAYFAKTGFQIGVSDNAKKMDIWKGYFEFGTVVTGGNNAAGAIGAESMYFVLVEEPDLEQLTEDGKLSGYYGSGGKIPETVTLLPNYPNPFNPVTTISFKVPFDMQVHLAVYNILGQKVKTLYDHPVRTGQYNLIWDGTNEHNIPVAAGVYFYRLEAWENIRRNGVVYKENYKILTQKMTFLK
jgi:hypothetical protein